MNCRQGDKALVIRGAHAGQTVTCLELMGSDQLGWIIRPHPKEGPIWRVDRLISWVCPHLDDMECDVPYAPDRNLMPIRPDADPDEDHYPEYDPNIVTITVTLVPVAAGLFEKTGRIL